MYIERVQVEEGFLNGLNLEFTPGLIVIFGARGTGKTSVIELIRYALALPSYSQKTAARSLQHALGVLGSGKVTVSIRTDNGPVQISRSAGQQASYRHTGTPAPIVLSQGEVESIGISSEGRLRLIDDFLWDSSTTETVEADVSARIRSLTVEIAALAALVDSLSEKLEELPPVEAQLAEATAKQVELSRMSAELAEIRAHLDRTSATAAAQSVSQDHANRLAGAVTEWSSSLEEMLRSAPLLEEWREEEADPFSSARNRISTAVDLMRRANSEFVVAHQALQTEMEAISARRLEIDEEARQFRKRLESLQEGSGIAATQHATLVSRRAQLTSLQGVIEQRLINLELLVAKRAELLDQLERLRLERFERRKSVADSISETLRPRIRIEVEHASGVSTYGEAIAEALRGSGLRFGELALSIAREVSPRELLESVESRNAKFLSEAVGIPTERAMRVISHLRDQKIAELVSSRVEDEVRLKLLDGRDFKDAADLSTGQRCTTVLPVLLEHRDRILILDQPEDHIENAFIADTLIRALRREPDQSQVIVSTHNANIPVLADASRVIQMGSDGQRGFALLSAALDNPQAVDAISSVMEGGREAFRRRAEFYSQHQR